MWRRAGRAPDRPRIMKFLPTLEDARTPGRGGRGGEPDVVTYPRRQDGPACVIGRDGLVHTLAESLLLFCGRKRHPVVTSLCDAQGLGPRPGYWWEIGLFPDLCGVSGVTTEAPGGLDRAPWARLEPEAGDSRTSGRPPAGGSVAQRFIPAVKVPIVMLQANCLDLHQLAYDYKDSP